MLAGARGELKDSSCHMAQCERIYSKEVTGTGTILFFLKKKFPRVCKDRDDLPNRPRYPRETHGTIKPLIIKNPQEIMLTTISIFVPRPFHCRLPVTIRQEAPTAYLRAERL